MHPVLADFVAGTLGGCAGVTVGYPLDMVKVRLQTQSTAAPLYNGPVHCLKTMVKQESFWGLYKGMTSPLYGVAVTQAIVFGTYGNTMRLLGENSSRNQFLAGAFTGCVQSVISCPLELAKTRMQLQGLRNQIPPSSSTPQPTFYKGPLDVLRHLYRKQGLPGMYRGFAWTLTREIPSFGSYFLTYGLLTKVFTPTDTVDENGKIVHGHMGIGRLILAGGMSGVISWLTCFPQDVVKSRYQTNDRYTSARQCAMDSYRKEGWSVFTRGLGTTLVRSFPTNATTLTVVTLFLRHVRSLNDEKNLKEMVL
ncbi:hypothetical protein RvY_02136 [Ramazzottius varieornatus]|uniref:Mitochondrial basic amino acids transporter n=1 Tax=Ramazzottius varieornatus TaxID=947166 RepID=A0A1D1UTA9_RAMVA|nr:hypothetical protein RvY_02136 [Ramazzottius varieornatus]